MASSVHEFALRQWDDLSPEARLVIFHPDFRHHHLLLNRVLSQPDCVYLRLDGAELAAHEVEDQIDSALARYGPDLALADVHTLVIDEGDRVHEPELERLLPALVLERVRSRVVLLTRLVPAVVLLNRDLRAATRFLPTDEKQMLWAYAQEFSGDMRLLEVRALGTGRVQLSGMLVNSWDGVLPRTLFFYLVDRGMTTRSDIFETFWPTLTKREATNVFHVTKRKINEVLGLDLTVYWSGFYHIAPRLHLSYDASLFTGLVQDSAVVPADEAIGLLRRAIGLYRADFLVGVDMPWSIKRREELRQMYGEALVMLAKAVERRGELRQALGLYLRAATTNRHREDLVLSIMRLYRELGMHPDALQVYALLERELKQRLGVPPAPPVQELARHIRAELDGGASAQ